MKKLIQYSLLLLALVACEQNSDIARTGSGETTGQGGSLARFAVTGDHLYAVNGQELKVFDLSNASNAVYLSRHQLNTEVETIFPRDEETLFIGTVSGMYIYDVSQAPSISQRSVYQHITACDPVVANDSLAFVTLRSDQNSNFCFRSVNQLDIIDISDLDNPNLITSFPMVNPRGLGLYGDTLMVCDNGLKVLDISDPRALKLLDADEDFDAIDLIPYGNLVIAVGEEGLSQYRFFKGKLELLSSF